MRSAHTGASYRGDVEEHRADSTDETAGVSSPPKGHLRARNLRRYMLVPLYPLAWPIAYGAPRRPGLWVFAYAQGFKDNPRYLFEHVVAAGHRGVEAVWLAQTSAEADAVRRLGYTAVAKRSLRGLLLSLRAGVVVLGTGPSEVNRTLVGRAMIVQLWHGAPFKRLHADFPEGDELLGGSGLVPRLVNSVVRWATNRTRSKIDLFPAQSPACAARFRSAFRIGDEATPVLGTPRVDVLARAGEDAETEAAATVAALLPSHLRDAGRLVLFAPTWRDGRREDFLVEGMDLAALDALLEAEDAVLLIRLHPYGDHGVFAAAGIAAAKRVVLSPEADIDVNVLLRAVDLLITDYSAISVDFALLGRPIVYFMPDLEEYEGSRGMYESPAALTGGLHTASWPELQTALSRAFAEPGPYVRAAASVADRYITHRDTQNCERITAEMLHRCGLDHSRAPGV